MDVLRRHMWLWVVGGALLLSLLVILVFILINCCLSRAGKRMITQLKKRSDFNVQSNKYEERSPDTPPLPPRTQFLTAEAQSYENLADVPEYEQSSDLQPDYVKVEDEVDLHPPAPLYQRPHQCLPSGATAVRSYENLAEELDGKNDYVKVEEEEAEAADQSSEDYDDIGGDEDEDGDGDEDYDDVA